MVAVSVFAFIPVSVDASLTKRTIALIVVLVLIVLVAVVVVQSYLVYSAAKGVSVSISKVRANNIKISSATVLVTLAFANPSATNLPPVEVNFSAFLGGRYIGNGTLPQVIIGGNSVVMQTVSLNVTYTSVAVGVITSLSKGEYNVTVIGKAIVMLVASTIPVSAGFNVYQTCSGLTAQNCTQSYSIAL